MTTHGNPYLPLFSTSQCNKHTKLNMNIEIIPLITGLVAVVKQAGLPSRYAPIFAIVLGIVLNLPQGTSVAEVIQSVATGAFYGLSAVGLWEAGKLPSKFVDSE